MKEILDNATHREALDSGRLLQMLGDFEQQISTSLHIGAGPLLQLEGRELRSILFCGLGGSAIGGDFIQSLAGASLKVPLQVNRDYSIPGYVDRFTLAVICSYSGNTEETLSAFQQVRAAGAAVLCVSSGGEVQNLATRFGYARFQIPQGLPPRMAMGYSTVPLILALCRLGLIAGKDLDIEQSVGWVRERVARYGPAASAEGNPAKGMARALSDRVAVIYGSQARTYPMARRWAGQFCENSKQLAFFASLPEANHNQVVGWQHPASGLKRFLPVVLRDRDDHVRVQLQIDFAVRQLRSVAGECLEVWSEGENWLERLWMFLLLGDYASLYLAFLNGEDPLPIPAIESLKNELKKS